jgi:hypothetical protein
MMSLAAIGAYVGGRHRKVGAGGTAVIGQLIHALIVKLIVTNTIKTKKPTESWA